MATGKFDLNPSKHRAHRNVFQSAVSDTLYREVMVDAIELEKLRAQVRQLKVFYTAALRINESMNPIENARIIAQSAAEALRTKACSLLLLNADRSELVHSASYGLSERFLAKGPILVGKSITDVMEGESVTVSDAQNDPRIQYPDMLAEEGIISILSVPARRRNEIIGVIRFYSDTRREFTDYEIEFAEALSSISALAVEHAAMYSTLTEQFHGLRRQQIPWAENFNKPRWR